MKICQEIPSLVNWTKTFGTLHEDLSMCMMFSKEQGNEMINYGHDFMRIHLGHKKHLLASYSLSIHLSTCISVSPTEQIFMKLDTGDFHKNLSRNSECHYNQTKIFGTSHAAI
jgi:hypothetical protein